MKGVGCACHLSPLKEVSDMHLPTQAIRRTTPALLGLFSLIALLVDHQMTRAVGVVRQAAWYHKRDPTFSDALALVRKELSVHATFCGSPSANDTVKVPTAYVERLTKAVCCAA